MKLAKCDGANLRIAGPLRVLDRLVDDVVAVASIASVIVLVKENPLGQQVHVAQQRVALHDPLAGIQIGNVPPDQIAGETS